jgi:hypothetical protein
MLQPSMYFVLRNIPLFAGSYFITEVSHSISIDDFSTSISGTRQAAPTLPKVDTLFQTIKRELLTNLGSVYKNNNRQTTGIVLPNINSLKNSITNSLNGGKQNDNAATCEKIEEYNNYVKYSSVPIQEFDIEPFIGTINIELTVDIKIKLCIFTIIWIESGLIIDDFTNKVKFYGNNPSGIPLTYYYPNLETYSFKENNINKYMCLKDSKNNTQSYAMFSSIIDSLSFLRDTFSDNIFNKIINITDPEIFANEFAKVWIEYFPYNKFTETPSIFTDYTSTNSEEYQILLGKIKKAFEIYNKVPQ